MTIGSVCVWAKMRSVGSVRDGILKDKEARCEQQGSLEGWLSDDVQEDEDGPKKVSKPAGMGPVLCLDARWQSSHNIIHLHNQLPPKPICGYPMSTIPWENIGTQSKGGRSTERKMRTVLFGAKENPKRETRLVPFPKMRKWDEHGTKGSKKKRPDTSACCSTEYINVLWDNGIGNVLKRTNIQCLDFSPSSPLFHRLPFRPIAPISFHPVSYLPRSLSWLRAPSVHRESSRQPPDAFPMGAEHKPLDALPFPTHALLVPDARHVLRHPGAAVATELLLVWRPGGDGVVQDTRGDGHDGLAQRRRRPDLAAARRAEGPVQRLARLRRRVRVGRDLVVAAVHGVLLSRA